MKKTTYLISSKDANENNLENKNVNKSLENNKVLEIEIKNKNINSSYSPHLKLFNKLNMSHENEKSLNLEKKKKNMKSH